MSSLIEFLPWGISSNTLLAGWTKSAGCGFGSRLAAAGEGCGDGSTEEMVAARQRRWRELGTASGRLPLPDKRPRLAVWRTSATSGRGSCLGRSLAQRQPRCGRHYASRTAGEASTRGGRPKRNRQLRAAAAILGKIGGRRSWAGNGRLHGRKWKGIWAVGTRP